jgi:hypothetical protein
LSKVTGQGLPTLVFDAVNPPLILTFSHPPSLRSFGGTGREKGKYFLSFWERIKVRVPLNA